MTAPRDPLTTALLEIERHVARDGWDGPTRLFALVSAADALAHDPALAGQLPAVARAAEADPGHLLSVEQQDLPDAGGVEELLGRIAWPREVDGAALVVERIVVPPEAESALPADEADALQALAAHPDRQDVRLAAAVLRDGSAQCAVRTRSHDSDDAVGVGPDVAPGLVAALRSTLT